ncbi:MAG TPA: NAD(P)-binding protein, partial [Thermodesulfobacteriota bacterium]|nr:NAD(P)-binding protein [Thermodesulfobacteriota bacterium]
MIIDARRLPQGYTIKSDICIVGAGAAGITLAHELRNERVEIVLLESGGMKFESETQDLYKGEVVCPDYHGPLDRYRQRRFGGTTTVWGGRCAPFDEIDFEFRPHVPYSGWPISKQDLDLYYERAHAYCELGAYTYDVRDALSNVEKFMIPGFESEIVS